LLTDITPETSLKARYKAVMLSLGAGTGAGVGAEGAGEVGIKSQGETGAGRGK